MNNKNDFPLFFAILSCLFVISLQFYLQNTPQTQQVLKSQAQEVFNINQPGNGINFTPQDPKPDSSFKLVVSSTTSYQWIHLKILKSDNSLVWEAPKDGSQPKTASGNPNTWTYSSVGLPEGQYKVVFFINCNKGCKEQFSRSLFIGSEKKNEIQVVPTEEKKPPPVNNQNQVKKTVPQPPPPQNNNNQTQPDNVLPVNATMCNTEIRIWGPKESKYNVIFLPSKYSDATSFINDAKTAANTMDQTNLGPNLISKINFWLLNRVDIDLHNPSSTPTVIRDTICHMNAFVVIENNPTIGGVSYGLGNGSVALTSGSIPSLTLPHELGHAIASLMDEYQLKNQTPMDIQVINCSKQSSGNEGTPCPGWEQYGPSGVGCFQVCGFNDWFRPTSDSIMAGGINGVWHMNNIFNPPSITGWEIALSNYQ